MPGSAGDEHDQEELIRPERESRDYEGPCALAEDGGIRGAEGPRAVPEIVARSGYEEGDRRRGEVVQPGREQRRVDGEVDRVARGTDRTEADELVLEQKARCADRHPLTLARARRAGVRRSAGSCQNRGEWPGWA